MRTALRISLVLLVLANLAFVLITDAAHWTWLGPLVALTVAAPWLQRLTRYVAYRVAWNVAVIGVFALLVRHLLTAGAQLLLEDGLLLAALCQVHLLNNIGHRQKPDLLFFNSFLIAVVTSFLSLDLGYSVVFLVYAPLLVVAMHLLAYVHAGIEGSPWPAVRDGLWRGALVVGVTLGVFFFLPRNFERRGYLGDRIRLRPPRGLEVDFTEEVSLDRSGDVRASDRVVMKVRVLRGGRAGVPGHWRGATLAAFDGQQWQPAVPQSVFLPDGNWSRGGSWPGARVEVKLLHTAARRLFAPLESQRLELATRDRAEVYFDVDGTFRCRARGGSRQGVGYFLEFDAARPARGGRGGSRGSRFLRRYLELEMGSVPRAARDLARQLRGRLPADADQHRVVEEMRRYLAARYRYLRPGAPDGARGLRDFLEEKAGGHCEIFATALAVMLRAQRIPARLVTGYRSEEWDETDTVLTIRARHAHAWVEVYDPRAGWYTVDPTPPADDAIAAAGAGWFGRLKVWAADLWVRITGFNEEGRERALVWLAALPGRRPLATAAIFALLVLGVLATRMRRRRRIPAAVRAYARVVSGLKFAPRPGETPRELLARARGEGLHPVQLAALERATREHERRRYHAQA